MATPDGNRRSQLDQDLNLFAQVTQPDPPLGECFTAAGVALVMGAGFFFLGGLIPSSNPYADAFAWVTFGALMVCCIAALLAALFAIVGGPVMRAIAARRFQRLPQGRKDAVTAALSSTEGTTARSRARRWQR